MSVRYSVFSAMKGGWAVQRNGTRRATSIHATQNQAIRRARELAKRDAGGTLFVHRADGTVKSFSTYGKERYHRPER